MKKEEERFEEVLEQHLAGQALPKELLELLSTEETEQLHLAARLAAVQPPPRDPKIVADQRRSVQELAAKNRQRKPAVIENAKNGWAVFTTRLSWQAFAFVGILLIILVGGIFAAGRWSSSGAEFVTSTSTLPVPTNPLITQQPDQEFEPSYEFIDIEPILAEIDREVCREALATRMEIQAQIARGIDLVELETAVNELIDEFGNCPQTLLLSDQLTSQPH